jgi:hypothetical protein
MAMAFAEVLVNQCHVVAKKLYELTPNGGTTPIVIGIDYQTTVQPVLAKQLATGDLRLAAMLNAILGRN